MVVVLIGLTFESFRSIKKIDKELEEMKEKGLSEPLLEEENKEEAAGSGQEKEEHDEEKGDAKKEDPEEKDDLIVGSMGITGANRIRSMTTAHSKGEALDYKLKRSGSVGGPGAASSSSS